MIVDPRGQLFTPCHLACFGLHRAGSIRPQEARRDYRSPHRHYANLGFYRGAALAPQALRLERAGKLLRHIKVDTVDTAISTPIRDVLLEAMKERRVALGL